MLKKLALLLTITLAITARVFAQPPTNGYPPKINSAGMWLNRVRPDSAGHMPHKYALTLNTTDTTPQIFAYTTAGGDSLVYFVNGRYHIVGVSGGGGTTYSADESTLHLSGTTFSIHSGYTGQSSINTLGTITSGVWQSTAIADTYIASAGTWNAKLSSVLNSANIFVGNGSNIATGVVASGDLTINNAGVFTLKNVVTAGSCTNCNLTVDANGRATAFSNGTGGGGGNPFNDNTALVQNNADHSRQVTFDASGITTGTNRTIAVPDANGTMVLTGLTQTLTNKTINATSNTISNIVNSNLSGSAGITNTNLATMASHTYKGNNTGSSATPIDVTATQLTADLVPFTTSAQGAVPSPGGTASGRILQDDGAWHAAGSLSVPPNIGSFYRIYSPATPGFRTLAPGYGEKIDSTTNANALTVGPDTSLMAPKYTVRDTAAAIRNAQRWPAESTVGQIYYKNGWTNTLNDFQNNSGTGLTVTNTNGFITIVPNSINWGNTLDVNPIHLMMINRWSEKYTIVVKAVTSGSTGIGPEVRTVQSGGSTNGIQCYVVGTSAGAGSLQLVAEGGTPTLNSHSGHQLHVGDSLDLTLTLRDTAMVFICKNWTTGFTDSVNYAFVVGTRTPPYTSAMGLVGHGDGTGSYQLQAVQITSDYIKNANILFLGSSKQQGFRPDNWHGRAGDSLGRLYPHVALYAEGSGRYVDVRNRLEEAMSLNPYAVILHEPCNDLRSGFHTLAQVQADYTIVHDAYKAAGRPVFNCVWPEDTTSTQANPPVALSAWNAWVKAKWPSEYIDTYDSMSTNGNLKAAYQQDLIHPNQAGNNAAIRAYVASGLLSTLNPNRLEFARTSDINNPINGDSVSGLPVDKKVGYVRHDVIGGGQSNGVLQDADTVSGVSRKPFTKVPGTILDVDGIMVIVGSTTQTNGLGWTDPTTPTSLEYSMFESSRRLNIFTIAGLNVFILDTLGRFILGPGGSSLVGTTSWLTVDKNTASTGGITLALTQSRVPTAARKGGLDWDSIGNLLLTDSSLVRDTLSRNGRIKKIISDSLVTRLGSLFYQTIQSNTTSQTQRAKLNFSSQFTTTDNSGNGSTDISLTSVTTQSPLDSTTKPASTAYVDEAVRSQWVRITANSGSTILAANDQRRILFDPATAGTMTVQFVALKDGQEIELYFGGTIAAGSSVFSSLTVSYSGGGIMDASPPTSATSGQVCLRYVYNKALDKFYRKP